MYIDAYDWVMVPTSTAWANSPMAASLCTKPYISGSNYLRRCRISPQAPGKPLDRSLLAIHWSAPFFFLSSPAYLHGPDCSIAELPGNRVTGNGLSGQLSSRVNNYPILRYPRSLWFLRSLPIPPVPTPTLRRRDRYPDPSNTRNFLGNFVSLKKKRYEHKVNLTVIWRYGGYPCN